MGLEMSENFFDESSEQSEVKSLLVSKYFWAWAKVMIGAQKRFRPQENRIAYIDLFAGPGRYKDGSASTPLMILRQAIEDPEMRQRLVVLFNDKDPENVDSLQNAINGLAGIETLAHQPKILNIEVGNELAERFEKMNLIPTLFFVDPWGYKGLSLRLIDSVVKDFGCDCIFFFNYNRINMGLSNRFVNEHINALFAKERANLLREKVARLDSRERELTIVNEICEALREMGREYVLPFCFKNANGRRTSHHLIFVSKHVRGYEIMKQIMARHSSSNDQGIASFDFNPAISGQLRFLFDLSRPLDELGDLLLTRFAGRTLTMKKIYELHQVNTPYIAANYKDALNQLEEKGMIVCNPPAASRRMRQGKRTFADSVKVTFPRQN
jgi:three-Cys-motif partner protein